MLNLRFLRACHFVAVLTEEDTCCVSVRVQEVGVFILHILLEHGVEKWVSRGGRMSGFSPGQSWPSTEPGWTVLCVLPVAGSPVCARAHQENSPCLVSTSQGCALRFCQLVKPLPHLPFTPLTKLAGAPSLPVKERVPAAKA